MATVTDDFTRADAGTLGANWTVLYGPGYSVVSHEAVPNGSTTETIVTWSANAFTNDQSCICQFIANRYAGPVVRCDALGQNCYYILLPNFWLYKYVTGVQSLVYPNGAGANGGDFITLEAIGTTLTAYRNYVFEFSVTDSDIASGSAGLYGYNADNGTIDNWAATGAILPSSGGLFRNANLSGLQGGGPFFVNPLGGKSARRSARPDRWARRASSIYVPQRYESAREVRA